MVTNKPPKSILKKTSYPTTTTCKADRDHEVALYHANLIQQRKDTELTILLSIEALIDFPLTKAPYNAANPSPSDAQAFKNLLRPFQPSDYDALILERNINEHCGYTLCPNSRVKDGAAGKYRIIGKNGKAKDFRVVEKEELERWCSEACAKRALYVRVQLSESPAWEREAATSVNIDLLDEPKSLQDCVIEGIGRMGLGDGVGEDKKYNAASLALERGDRGLVNVNIQEKDVTRPAEAPSLDDEYLSGKLDTMHLSLEGHTSSFGIQRMSRHHEELNSINGEDDNEDTDWKL